MARINSTQPMYGTTKEVLKVSTESYNPSWVGEERRPGRLRQAYDGEAHKKDEAAAFVVLLRSCAKNKDLCRGSRVHDDILSSGLLPKCADALVTMYAKCGALGKAKELFDTHKTRNTYTWNALIAGYADKGRGHDALKFFERMQQEGVPQDAVTFVCVLKACGNIRAADKGEQIHDKIAKKGLLRKNVVLGTALVDMYARCGSLSKAQNVLKGLPVRNAISWNVLIAGYAQKGQGQNALKCFEQMQREGLCPDAVTFSCILKACASIKAADKGEQIHDEIAKQGLLQNNVVLGTALMDMYVKCGALAKARRVLEELPLRDVRAWSTMIAGYVQHGDSEQALKCFEQMQREGLSPDAVTFVFALKACGSIRAADRGEQIHDEITKQGLLGNNVVLGTALVDMYAKCGALSKARQVLEELPVRNVISWNALMAGYAEHGKGEQALNCFEQMLREGLCPDVVTWTTLIAGYAEHGDGEQALKCFEWMQCEGLSPDAATFICVLKACGSIRAADRGEQIHNEIAKQGLLGDNMVLGTALVDMYAKCGVLPKARQVLEELPVRNVTSWNALIAGYTEHGEGKQALNCFEQMQHEGLCPNAATFLCILKTCGSMGTTHRGEQIHDEIAKQGLLQNNAALGNALVRMYAQCGALAKARQVLEELPFRDVIAWSAMIAGYTQHGDGEQALKCFEEMQREGLSADAVTFVCALEACGSIRAADRGEQIHNEITKQELLGNNIVVGTALVDMYAKCGALSKARRVLEELPARNVVTWTALIAGYAEHGKGEQALNCFEQMLREGLCPNEVTFICILKACGSIGAADKGEQIHDEIAKQGLLRNNIALGNALVDMYSRCGALAKARRVLQELPFRNVISWNALIAGSVQQGEGEQALSCFVQMQHEGLSPDATTFARVLNACSRLGLVEDAQMHFLDMSTKYGLKPDLRHYTCLVDLFGRAGHLDKAVGVIEKLPSSHSGAWYALLGACWKWGNVSVGRWAFEHAVQVDKSDASAYFFMANIYAAAGMQKDAEHIEAMRDDHTVRRKPA